MTRTFRNICVALTIGLAGLLVGCRDDDATVASANISKAADNFEINRRIVFINGITDKYLLSVEGRCSTQRNVYQLYVTCRTGKHEFKKHYVGVTDNTPYFIEQLQPVKASTYHYRVTFKPQSILPDIDFRGDAEELTTNTAK